MPRDTDKKAYITVAIPIDSRLMRQLLEDEKQKGTPKSHLIVGYADEYVRLFIQGNTAPIVTQNSLPMAKISASNQQDNAIISSEISDEDLAEFYGD